METLIETIKQEQQRIIARLQRAEEKKKRLILKLYRVQMYQESFEFKGKQLASDLKKLQEQNNTPKAFNRSMCSNHTVNPVDCVTHPVSRGEGREPHSNR